MSDDVIQRLCAHELFRGLTAEETSLLMSKATNLTVAAEQPVFEAGADERALYFLLDGTVEIELEVSFANEVILDELNPISVFGETSFFHSRAHGTTARALTEVTLARLDRSVYDELLQSNSRAACRLGANAAEILAAKLQHTDDWISELLKAEEAHRVQQKWVEFRQTLGHAFDRPEGGGFSTTAGWR